MHNELMHILLIEDDEIDSEAIVRAFRKYKVAYPLVHAANGLEALHMLRGEQGYDPLPRPFIILSDLSMPQMNGHEFLKTLRSDTILKRSIIFILTTSQSEEDITKAYDYQVAGYFLKSTLGTDFCPVIRLLDLYQTTNQMPPFDTTFK
jgi:CheY-like chemotaxis protein